jgi:hypothetical protein
MQGHCQLAALAPEGRYLAVQTLQLLCANTQDLSHARVLAWLIASCSSGIVRHCEQGENPAYFIESKSKLFPLMDQTYHVDVVFRVDPVACRCTKGFLEQPPAFVKTNRLDAGASTLR